MVEAIILSFLTNFLNLHDEAEYYSDGLYGDGEDGRWQAAG
jgi:hypothetical protein